MHNRRSFVVMLVAAVGVAVTPTQDAEALPARRVFRRTRRRVRRRIRRRHRRRVRRRVVAGRSMLVVPVALAVGWELVVDDRVVTVVAFEKESDGTEVVVVKDASGKVSKEPIVREDTSENSAELEGSQLPDGDTTTPGIETEIEVEVDD